MVETAGSQSSEWIRATALGSGEAAARLVGVARAQFGFDVAALGPDRFQFTRRRRPEWVVPTAIVVGVLSLGIGLLLLLVKDTEMWTAQVVEDRDGVTVQFGRNAPHGVIEAMRLALLDDGGSHLPTPVKRQPIVAHPPPAPIDSHRNQLSGGEPVQPGAVTSSLILVFADGTELSADQGGVIGRNPIADTEVPGGRVVQLHDESVSKTHLSYRVCGVELEVRDRHSTNGSSVMLDGVVRSCPPDEWVGVPNGGIVLVGDQQLRVVRRCS